MQIKLHATKSTNVWFNMSRVRFVPCERVVINRHLKEMGCLFSILNVVRFDDSRDVLERKRKYLRQVFGMGNTHNAAWFLLTQHLGLRGK